jgi:hypothetical protein
MDPSLLGRPIPTPTAQKPASSFPARLVIIVAILLGAIIGGFLLIASSSDDTGQLLQRVSARQATTLRLVADGQKNLTRDDLKKINSELSIILLSDNASLQAELADAGIKKLEKEVVSAEADQTTFEKLASAKLNAQYDATYQTTLTQKLESLRALLRELHDKTKSKSLKAVLARGYTHLTTYVNELSKLGTH